MIFCNSRYLNIVILLFSVESFGRFKSDHRVLQDIAQRLLEAVSEIAGSSLEQTTFFRRNLAVKPGPQVDVSSEMDDVTTDVDMAEGQLPYRTRAVV